MSDAHVRTGRIVLMSARPHFLALPCSRMTPTDSELRQSILDEEHLKLLGLGYLVSAILSAGFSLLGLVYGAMGLVFGRAIADAPASAGQPPIPAIWNVPKRRNQ